MQRVAAIAARYPAWDLIYLGGVPLTLDSGALRVEGVPGVLACKVIESHAYIMSANFRARALVTPPYGTLDFWLARTAAQVFFLEPELIEQDETAGSNIDTPSAMLAVRGAWKAHHARLRGILRELPLRYVELGLVCVVVLALWALSGSRVASRGAALPNGFESESTQSNVRAFFRASLVVLLLVLLTASAVDIAVMDAHLHDRALHDRALHKVHA